MKQNFEKIFNNVVKQIKKLYPKVCLIVLQGSQNYNLDDDQSDVDVKAFVVPTVEDLLYCRYVENATVATDGGLAEVKDIRRFPELLKKANPTYIELLFSKMVWTAPWFKDVWNKHIKGKGQKLIEERTNSFFNATRGMILQKMSSIFKRTEGNSKMFDEFGYNPKDLCHAARLVKILEDVNQQRKNDFTDWSYEEILRRNDDFNKYLRLLKREKLSIEEVKEISRNILHKVQYLYQEEFNKVENVSDKTINEIEKQVIEYFCFINIFF